MAVDTARVAKPNVTMSVFDPCAARAAHCAASGDGAAALEVGQTLTRATSSNVHTTEKVIETATPVLVLLRASESNPDQVVEGAGLDPPPGVPPLPPADPGHDEA